MSNHGTNWMQIIFDDNRLKYEIDIKINDKFKKVTKFIYAISSLLIPICIGLTIFGLDYISIRENVTKIKNQLEEFEPKINEFTYKVHSADSLLNEIMKKKNDYDKDLNIHFNRLNDIYNRQINIARDYSEILKDAKNEYKSADSMLIDVKANYEKSKSVLIKAIEKLREAEKNTSAFREKANNIIDDLEILQRKQEIMFESKVNFLNNIQKILIEQAKEINKMKNELNALEIKFNQGEDRTKIKE